MAVEDSGHQVVTGLAGVNASGAMITPTGDATARTLAQLAARVLVDVINVKDPKYGAVGDGVTDDTGALAAWVAAMPASGAHMVAPPGVYLTTAALSFSGKSNFRIDGKGATIKYANATAVSSGKYLLDFVSCADGVIDGLVLDGNRANRTPAEVPAHLVNVYTSSARLTFRGVRAINAVVDGFYVATGTPAVEASYPADITFENCETTNAWRNGMSIIAALRPTVRDGDYSSSTGTSPQAGIDVEPDASATYTVKDAVIEGVRFRDNAGYGLMLSGANMTVANVRSIARNLKFSGNGSGGLIVGPSTAPLLDGITVEDHPVTVTRGLIDVNANASTGVVIRNVEIRDATTPNGAGHYGIYVHSAVTGPVSLDNVRLRNVAAGGAGVYLATQALVSRVSEDTVTGPGLVMTAANSRASDILLRNTGGITFQITGADSEVDGATLIDPSGTNTAVYFSGARPRARNISVIQTTSIPAGQKAIQFVGVVPIVAQNLLARSAGTDYTASNGIVFGSGTVGAVVSGVKPQPTTGQTIVETRTAPTYGASVAIDASLGNVYAITATNGTGFTIANPTNASTGQTITIQIRNTSGGVLGAVTWDTLYKLAAWTSPATGNSRAVTFLYDGTNWVEVGRVAADVPN